ncbi:MAG: ABC transporter permease [Acidobacteriia bacterium]|nr:ABC transporter permease [Terriglobia bacterium]
MKRNDLLELAGRNLRESLLRSSLTTLGIAVGVASLVAMLSLGVGLQNLANGRLERSGLFNTVMVLSARAFGPSNRAEQRNNPADVRVLDEAARQEIARLPNILEVYPELRFPTEARYNDRQRFTTVSGLPPSARDSDAFDGMQGHFFSGPKAEEAVLQADFAKQLADSPGTLIGREITLRYAEQGALAAGKDSGPPSPSVAGQAGDPWGFSVVRREIKLRITGITESEPGGALRGPARAGIFIPLQLAEELRPVQSLNMLDAMRSPTAASTYQALVVRLSNPKAVRAAEDAIKRLGFRTFSLLDVTQNLRRFFAVLDLFLGMFGSLALAVASLGIINTLVMAILERRREIGVMKALGASDSDVKRLFFAEAGAMGFVGGLAGVALGWAIGRVINFGTNIYLRRQELPAETIWTVPWWLVVGAIAFAILVSLASGLYPAARAAKLDPVKALRYE